MKYRKMERRAKVIRGKYAGSTSAEDLRKKLAAEDYSIFSWQDAPGAYYSPHSHPHDEYIVVHSGEIVFEINGEDVNVTAGGALDLPAETIHGAENRGKRAVGYFICTR